MDVLDFLRRSAVLLAAAASMFLACADAAVSPDELASTVRWFDSLQWPDLREKPYVEVTFGKGYVGGKMVDGPQLRGFLVEEDDKGFTVFSDGTRALRISLDGRGWPCVPERFRKSPPDAAEDSRVVIRRLELADAVEEVLGELRRQNAKDELVWSSSMDRRISDRTALFVLARCCARLGRSDLAGRLESALMDLTPVFPSRRPGLKALPFPAAVENEFGHVQMWKAVVDFGNPEVTRTELLNGFERLLRDFPSSEHSGRARAFAEILRRMIAEDEAHAAANTPLEELPVEDKVRELIFQLRNQNGRQWDQPGSCDIFGSFGARHGNTPAHQLVALGYAAVPALIDALEDTRLTRSVGFHRDFYFSHYVLSVGDCAKAIISRIARRSFPTSTTTVATMQTDDEAKKTRVAVEAWWHDLQSKGEESLLIEGVRSGSSGSIVQAERLIALDPAAALDAIKTGILNAQSHGTRARLVETLAKIKNDAAIEALRQEMISCTGLDARVAAARKLFEHGDRSSIAAMIEEWRNWTPSGKDSSADPYPAQPLVVFLGTCNEPYAIRALSERFSNVPTEVRIEILEAVTGGAFRFYRLDNPDKVRPPEVEQAAEELVVRALDDRSTRFGMSGSTGEITFRDPRVCDVAAVILADRWPKKYGFKWATTRQERDIQIAEARNVWRFAQGLPPSALPERPSHASAVNDPNVVAAIRWIGGEELRDVKIVVGEPLSAETLIDTLIRLHPDPSKGCKGFTLIAERAGDRRGFVVEIEWQRSPKPVHSGGWSFNSNITLGQKTIPGGDGRASSDYQWVASGYEDQRRSLEKVLAADPGESVSISFQTMLNGQ